MRETQQFIGTLRQAEMAEPFPQPIPAAIRLRRAMRRSQQGRQIEFGLERNVDVQQRQPRQ